MRASVISFMSTTEMIRMKVLCLHGYTQNAAIFRRKTAVLRNSLKHIDFVYVDAAHIVPAEDLETFQTRVATTAPAANASDRPPFIKDSTAADATPRTWWIYEESSKTYNGFDKSLALLAGVLENEGPFNGILGFSQGAAIGALITAHLEKPVSMHGPPIKHPPFSFSILISGFKSRDPTHTDAYFNQDVLHTPSLIVVGTNDAVVTPDRTKDLAACFESSEIFEHDGG